MARVSPKQHSFARGEITAKLHGRQDTELYYTALEIARNYIVDGRGILERRPGNQLMGQTKNNQPAVIIPFVYDQEQSYILEFGDLYMRPWFGLGQVLDSGSISETVTPFTAAEVDNLSFTQIRDIMWTAHANHAPGVVKRNTPTAFTYEDFERTRAKLIDTIHQNLNVMKYTKNILLFMVFSLLRKDDIIIRLTHLFEGKQSVL